METRWAETRGAQITSQRGIRHKTERDSYKLLWEAQCLRTATASKLLSAMREWCLEGEKPFMTPDLLEQVNSFLEEAGK